MRYHPRLFAIGAVAALAGTMFALPGTAVADSPQTPTPTTAPTPTPTKTTPKVRPVITLVQKPANVVYGSTATVRFKVAVSGTPRAGQPVRIGVTPAGRQTEYTDTTTGDGGTVAIVRDATRGFTVRLVAAATDTTLETASTVAAVAVVSKALVSSPRGGAFQVILYGADGQTVQVQRLFGRTWRTTRTYTAKLALYTLNDLPAGDQYRIFMPTSAAIVGLTSTAVTVS